MKPFFQTPKEVFQDIVKGKNFMTPEIIGYGWISKENGIVYEFSEGYGSNNDSIIGVTVVEKGKQRSELSRCFTGTYQEAKREAIDYIQELIYQKA